MKIIQWAFVLVLFTGCATQQARQAETVVSERVPASEISPDPVLLHRPPAEINPTGFTRKPAKVFLPIQYDHKDKWPLVVLLHGFRGTAQAEDYYLTLRFRTSNRGFILVTPEGTVTPDGTRGAPGKDGKQDDFSGAQFWNATDYCCDLAKTGVNDVEYLSKLIDAVEKTYHVDSDRIYLIGHSNGGFMANRLACEIGDRLAGIASLAGGSFKRPGDCRKPTPVPYLQIHAEDDGTISYGDNDRYAGGKATIAQWLEKNGCKGEGKAGEKKDFLFLVPGAETTPRLWSKCASRAPVAFWTIAPFSGPMHSGHVPLFHLNFTDEVLSFLFQQTRARK